MSHFLTLQTELTDAILLHQALVNCNMPARLHEKPVELRGWTRRQVQKAEIVLRGKDLGTRSDVGFAKGQDGRFSVIHDPMEHNFGEGVLHRLTQEYALAGAMRKAEEKGWTLLSKEQVPVEGEGNLFKYQVRFAPAGAR